MPGFAALTGASIAEVAVELVVGVLPDGAGVEHHDVGVLSGSRDVPGIFEHVRPSARNRGRSSGSRTCAPDRCAAAQHRVLPRCWRKNWCRTLGKEWSNSPVKGTGSQEFRCQHVLRPQRRGPPPRSGRPGRAYPLRASMDARRRVTLSRSARSVRSMPGLCSLRSTSSRAADSSVFVAELLQGPCGNVGSIPLSASSRRSAPLASFRVWDRLRTHMSANSASSTSRTSSNLSRTASATSSGTLRSASLRASCSRLFGAAVSCRSTMARATEAGSGSASCSPCGPDANPFPAGTADCPGRHRRMRPGQVSGIRILARRSAFP